MSYEATASGNCKHFATKYIDSEFRLFLTLYVLGLVAQSVASPITVPGVVRGPEIDPSLAHTSVEIKCSHSPPSADSSLLSVRSERIDTEFWLTAQFNLKQGMCGQVN